MIKLFYFLADYSNVEWAIHIDMNKEEPVFYLGSIGEDSSAGSYETYMDFKPDISMHSHPGVKPTAKEEVGSMGILQESDKTYIVSGSDWYNVQNSLTAPTVFVYFPVSGHRYILSKKGYSYKTVGQ